MPSTRLSVEEVLGALHCERFVDEGTRNIPRPNLVWATLLDEQEPTGCSIRTMYRILEEHGEVRERSELNVRHPNYTIAGAAGRSAQPGLVVGYYEASWPRQAWTYYYLYVILDIFSTNRSRGWLDAGSPRKCGARAHASSSESCRKQDD